MVHVSSLGAREGGGEQPGVSSQSRALGSAPASGLLVEAGPQRLWRTEGRGEAQPAVPGTTGPRVRVQVGLLRGARHPGRGCGTASGVRHLRLGSRGPHICRRAPRACQTSGPLPPPLAWPECLARPLRVLRGCQCVLFGCDLEQSQLEDCAGFQRARQGEPYWVGGPHSNLWARREASPPSPLLSFALRRRDPSSSENTLMGLEAA